MKKILIDLTPFVYGRAAGYNEFVLSFLDGLVENSIKNFNINILIRADQRKFFKSYENHFGIREISAESVISRVIYQNLFFIGRNEFDFYLFMANFAPPFLRRPYLLVTHDLNFISHPENFSSIGRFLRKNISRWSIKRAKISVAISKQTSTEIKNEFGLNSVVIYNPVRGVYASDFSDGKSSKNRILCMSSLAKHKNIDSTYKACIAFAEDFPDVSFDFIGNWTIDQFPSKIRHQNVRLHGYVDGRVKAEILNEAACILAPSIYEGFGMPYAEAMVMKKSLICSRIPISEEISMDYSYYIEYPFGVEQIYNALLAAKNKNFTPGVIEDEHVEKFSPKTSAKFYLNAIEKALNIIN